MSQILYMGMKVFNKICYPKEIAIEIKIEPKEFLKTLEDEYIKTFGRVN